MLFQPGSVQEYVLRIERYHESQADEWDRFVCDRSINGTFMHTRNFVNYHPADRFTDCSLIYRTDSGSIAACIPACRVEYNGKDTFFSHRGCTYGGLIVHPKQYTAVRVRAVLQHLIEFTAREGIQQVCIKLPHELYTGVPADVVEYAAFQLGFQSYMELNTHISFAEQPDVGISSLARGKRGHVRKARRSGVIFRSLSTDDEVAAFYSLLQENLSKYHTRPVHTLTELLDFKNVRLSDTVRFFGVFDRGTMCAAAMTYVYPRSRCLYTTYIAAMLHPPDGLSPASVLTYELIQYARRHGMQSISFGISTEDQGRYLNEGLIDSKESFGSRHSLHRTVFADIPQSRAGQRMTR